MAPLLAILLCAGPALAGRVVVDGAGAGDYLDLQAAYDALVPGDYVLLRPGTYAGVDVTRWAAPLLATDGPAVTVVDGTGGTGLRLAAPGPGRVEGLGFRGGLAIEVVEGDASLAVVDARGVDEGLRLLDGRVELDGVLLAGVAGCGLCVDGGTLTGRHLTWADTAVHLSVGDGEASLEAVVGWRATTANTACTGAGTASLTGGLLDAFTGSPWEACVAGAALRLGVDPGFLDVVDDGDWSDDDLTLAAGSVAADQVADCSDPDGTDCDWGGASGPARAARAADADGDLLPDAWEHAQGMDPGVADDESDADGDGLDALGEYLHGTLPGSADTDGDGTDDLTELLYALDPTNPDDGAPVVVVAELGTVFVGEGLTLDGSATYDPTDDALGCAWSAETPGGVTVELGAEVTAAWTPDEAGTWRLRLVVTDGVSERAWEAEVLVLPGRVVRVPEDVADWGILAPLVVPGMEVVFGGGAFAVGALPSVDDLTLTGQGPDVTLLTGALGLRSPVHVRVRDLALVADGTTPPLDVRDGALVELANVRLMGDAIQALTVVDGVVVAWEVEATSDRDAVLVLGGALYAAASTFSSEGNQAVDASAGARVRLRGVLLTTTDASSTVTLAGAGTVADVGHVTLAQPAGDGFRLEDGSSLLGAHLYVAGGLLSRACPEDLGLAGAVEVRVDFVATQVGSSATQACPPDLHFVVDDPAALDAELRPLPGSLALDAGDPRSADLDGTRPDLGHTGGPVPWDGVPGLVTIDSDGDGLWDTSEVASGADPLGADGDEDGSTDLAEVRNGGRPDDPEDQLPAVAVLEARVAPGESARVAVLYGADPQGETCTFAWEDLAADDPERGVPDRLVTVAGPGVVEWPFSVTCGSGSARGAARVVAEEAWPVPGAWGDVASAVAAAPAHARLDLAPGTWAGEMDLRGRPLRLVGSTDAPGGLPRSVLTGSLLADDRLTSVQDLVVDGEVLLEAGTLQRGVTWGELWVGEATLRNVIVDPRGAGGLHFLGGGLHRYVTVDGTVTGRPQELRFAAVTGELRLDGDHFQVYGTSGPPFLDLRWDGRAPFLSEHADPAAALLHPGPPSVLLDSALATEPIFDADGSPSDVGGTGGPDGWNLDLDADGLDDAWESWWGEDQEPFADEDGDYLDTSQEYAAGTAPDDPDSDGDGLLDGLDPEPTTPTELGMVARVVVDDWNPPVGGAVLARAQVSGAGVPSLRLSWRVDDPEGRMAESGEGPSFRFVPTSAGSWSVTVEVEVLGVLADGREVVLAVLSAGSKVHTQTRVYVRPTDDLGVHVVVARPGTVLVLPPEARTEALRVVSDITIESVAGATATTLYGETTRSSSVVTVDAGVRLRLEGITLAPHSDGGGLRLRPGSQVELVRSRVVGGDVAIEADGAEVSLVSSAVLGSRRLATLEAGAWLGASFLTGGWPEGSAEGWVTLDDASLVMAGAALDLRPSPLDVGVPLVACAATPCRVLLDAVVAAHPLDVGVAVEASSVTQEALGLLLDPWDAPSVADADLRLRGGSVLRDSGPEGVADADGGPADVGATGGPWGNWPDVDDDRDGVSETEGDCDDLSASVLPDPSGEGCVVAGAGCAALGVSAGWGVVALAGLAAALRRRAGVVACGLLVAGPATAVDAETFSLAGGHLAGSLALELADPAMARRGTVAGGLGVVLAHNPLVFRGDDGSREAVVGARLGLEAVAVWQAAGPVRLEARVPYYALVELEEATRPAWGDARVGATALVRDGAGPWQVGITALVAAPTGDVGSYTGGRGPSGEVRLAGSRRSEAVAVLVNVGAAPRLRESLGDAAVGTLALAGVGLGAELGPSASGGLEVEGSLDVVDLEAGSRPTVEVGLWGRQRLVGAWSATLAVGTGLVAGVGAPQYRLAMVLGWRNAEGAT